MRRVRMVDDGDRTVASPRATAAPPADRVLSLQRSAGNAAVAALVVQRAWYVNTRNDMVTFVDEGDAAARQPEREVLALLGDRRPYRVVPSSGVDTATVLAREMGWRRVADMPRPRPAAPPPKKARRDPGPPGPDVSALGVIPDALLTQVLGWLVGTETVLGHSFARDPSAVAALTLVSKRWYALVHANPDAFGFHLKAVNAIVDKYREADHEAQRKEGVLDRADRIGLDAVAKEIVRGYPPATCTYVSLGNSPALFLEYLAVAYPGAQVVRLPLSGVTGVEAEQPGTEGYQRLQAYLDRVLGGVTPRDRVVVVDMAEHGRALAVTQQLLTAYLAARQQPRPVEMFGLTPVIEGSAAELPHLASLLSQITPLRRTPVTLGVQERLVAAHYKSQLLLHIFDKHLASDVMSGTRTEPVLDPGAYQRLQLVVRHAYGVNTRAHEQL